MDAALGRVVQDDWNVVVFDYPYLSEGRKRPDPLPKLIAAHVAALAEARRSHAGPVVLIGKSMGGRVGCHVALQEAVSAVVRLGYPLCGGGDPPSSGTRCYAS
jgi:predicted alpha/beta-hydrolase family hydrolase